MARAIEYSAGDFGKELDQLMSRENIRRIVEAGSAAAVKFEQEQTEAKGHVINRGLKEGISAGPYHEDLDTAWQYVYPSGTGDHGQDLTVVAYVINYGIGNKITKRGTPNKTGDKFITGDDSKAEEIVVQAMQAESDRLIAEINE